MRACIHTYTCACIRTNICRVHVYTCMCVCIHAPDAKSISIPEGPEWKRRCLSTGVPKPSDFARRGAQPHSIHTKVHRHGTMLAEFVLHYRSDCGAKTHIYTQMHAHTHMDTERHTHRQTDRQTHTYILMISLCTTGQTDVKDLRTHTYIRAHVHTHTIMN